METAPTAAGPKSYAPTVDGSVWEKHVDADLGPRLANAPLMGAGGYFRWMHGRRRQHIPIAFLDELMGTRAA